MINLPFIVFEKIKSLVIHLWMHPKCVQLGGQVRWEEMTTIIQRHISFNILTSPTDLDLPSIRIDRNTPVVTHFHLVSWPRHTTMATTFLFQRTCVVKKTLTTSPLAQRVVFESARQSIAPLKDRLVGLLLILFKTFSDSLCYWSHVPLCTCYLSLWSNLGAIGQTGAVLVQKLIRICFDFVLRNKLGLIHIRIIQETIEKDIGFVNTDSWSELFVLFGPIARERCSLTTQCNWQG